MKECNPVSMRIKLAAIGMTTVIVFVSYAAYSFQTLNKLKVNGAIYHHIVQGKDLIADILPPPEYVIESYLVVLQILGTEDKEIHKTMTAKLETLYSDYKTRHQFWTDDLEESAMKSKLLEASYRPAMEFYDIVFSQFVPAVGADNKTLAASLAYGAMREKYEEHRLAIDAVVKMSMDQNTEYEKQAAATIRIRTIIMIGFLSAGIVILTGLMYWMSTSLINSLMAAVNGLRKTAEQVSSASTQVSAASQSLAEGATEQAAGLEETSSSLEEMAAMTRQNADNAAQASTLACDAQKAVNGGAEAMERMAMAIEEIKKSSDETAKIIKVIDEIAFQTNLLALNAAVEAARAGESGKGFAVVAEEVRNLAMRSAEAAKNTTNLIDQSVNNSRNGVQICSEVKTMLDQIVQSIDKTTGLVGEIAAASNEQKQGVNQINTAVSQMDKITQQNAANAEESSSASQEMNQQAQALQQIIEELSGVIGGNK
jgi:hypothetical protein